MSYRRARDAHRLYGQDASWIPGAVSLTAPLQNLGYIAAALCVCICLCVCACVGWACASLKFSRVTQLSQLGAICRHYSWCAYLYLLYMHRVRTLHITHARTLTLLPSIEVPRGSRKAEVRRQEEPCAPSLLRYYRFEMLLGACVSMWAAHALWRKLRPLKDPAGFKFFRGKHKPT